jgi:hypothetical protein
LRRGVYYGLNEVGTRIWQLLSCARTVEELSETLLRDYKVPRRRLERDLDRFLRGLLLEGLVRVVDAAG